MTNAHTFRFLSFVILFFVFLACAEGREWWDNTHKHKTDAELFSVYADNSGIVLLKEDGGMAKVPLDRLSKSDKEYIAQFEQVDPSHKTNVYINQELMKQITDKDSKFMTPEKIKVLQAKAQEGMADAQMLLGICQFGGKGTPENIDAGLDWLRKAADQGHQPAKELGELLQAAVKEYKESGDGGRGFRLTTRGKIKLTILICIIIFGAIGKMCMGGGSLSN
ncbi:MAG: SHD1 domain-containing protein [Thermoguttaceae bacterium]|nr:SHD1 domain-containing protein [Thermoguttaceae bacterium]